MSFDDKYLKYKNKYLSLKNNLRFTQYGGGVAGGGAVTLPAEELQAELERCMRDKSTLIEALRSAGLPIPRMTTPPPAGYGRGPVEIEARNQWRRIGDAMRAGEFREGGRGRSPPRSPGGEGPRYPQFSQQTPEQRARVSEYIKRTTEEAEELARLLEFTPSGRQAFVMEKANVSYKRALDGLPYESPQWNSLDSRFKNF